MKGTKAEKGEEGRWRKEKGDGRRRRRNVGKEEEDRGGMKGTEAEEGEG
jgi:hypothetical protein